ncbi:MULTISPECIES: DNA/RNA non-specific endonuclease [unclassified Janthinobacterium]|uniref:DNA/RNA non-specific endonuclease n=1 Tax=unclassified Janthinobacterium TaxID=2610881 RepID=UPI002472F6D7|nr:DNA/RNA non-specific endonuclease [Janthinobacterium sp. CG_23.4]MDH6157861.1 endonuclease G [Janthinobacterium sp. CG_23.4]
MNLRKVVAGLAALSVAFIGIANDRGLLDFGVPQEKKERYVGTTSQAEALALYSAKQRRNSFEACADQFPSNKLLDIAYFTTTLKPMALCSNDFAVLYSQTSKTPLVVVERLSAARLLDAKGEVRTNDFFADPRIPANGRAELNDYRSQQPAVDRGHMAPAADSPDQMAMSQSFALSNMVPQDPNSNRKNWNKVEQDTRKFALRAQGNVFVFSGPIFDPGHETVGKSKVWKPTRLFKLVYDEATGRAWAYVLPNAESRIERPIDYATFVRTTDLNLLDGLRITGTIL